MALFCAAFRRDLVTLFKCPFLTPSRSSRVRFHLFVDRNIHTVFFPPISVSYLLLFRLSLVLSLLFLVAVISFYLFGFMLSSSVCIHVSTLFSMFFLFFLSHIVYLYHLSKVRQCASLSASLSSGLFVYVSFLSISRIVPSILWKGQPSFSLWWDSCSRAWFWEAFSLICITLLFFFRLGLFNSVGFQYSEILVSSFFLSELILTWFRTYIPSILCLISLLIVSMAHFSISHSIPISYIFIVSIRFFNSFSILANKLMTVYDR